MRSVGVHELKEQTSRILEAVSQEGETIEVTDRGQVVAYLVPATGDRNVRHSPEDVWAGLERLAAEIGARAPAGVTAEQVVREVRRDL